MKKSKTYLTITLGLVFVSCLSALWWVGTDRNHRAGQEAPGISKDVPHEDTHLAETDQFIEKKLTRRPHDMAGYSGGGVADAKDTSPDKAFLPKNADVSEPSGSLPHVLPNDRIDRAKAKTKQINDTRPPYERMASAGNSISDREVTRYDSFRAHARDTLPLLSAQAPDEDDAGDFQNIQPPPGELWIRIKPDYSISTKEIMDRTAAIYRARTGYEEPSVLLWVGGRPWKRIDYIRGEGS